MNELKHLDHMRLPPNFNVDPVLYNIEDYLVGKTYISLKITSNNYE